MKNVSLLCFFIEDDDHADDLGNYGPFNGYLALKVNVFDLFKGSIQMPIRCLKILMISRATEVN